LNIVRCLVRKLRGYPKTVRDSREELAEGFSSERALPPIPPPRVERSRSSREPVD